MTSESKARTFSLGRIGITAHALATLDPQDVLNSLFRHAQCDWGEVSKGDAAENELSLTEGLRLFSVYQDRNKTKFWIITEADRSSTTVLLPSDY